MNPAMGKPYGSDFPMVTVKDWVRSQAMLADYFGIEFEVESYLRYQGDKFSAGLMPIPIC